MTFIIAEAGVNHNGDVALARALVDAAHEAGADAVKFQAFDANALASSQARKAAYQANTTGGDETQLEMLRKLELSQEVFAELAEYCRNKGIEFLCTPFDHQSLKFLSENIRVNRIKISSGDVTNGPLLEAIGQTQLPAILSTGMCTLGDVEAGLGALGCGYLGVTPTAANRAAILTAEDTQEVLRRQVSLLHCTTEYPAPLDEVNLRSIATLRQAFGLDVGYSDHTSGTVVAVAAVALGASIIEKHFTLDRNLPGPDHLASLEPSELKSMVEQIRDVGRALGSSIKGVSAAEAGNLHVARKSLVAARSIAAGTPFGPDDITAKRPGTGVSPMRYWDYLGRLSRRPYAPDELIDE